MNFTLIVLTTLLMALNACSGKKANVTPDPDPGKKPPVDTPVVITPVTAFKSLNYLYKIAGKSTVAGIHNREPNSSPAVWTEKVYTVTGKYPGLWSGDFLFQQDNINNRQVMINEAIAQYKKGALVNIMWHACNPALAEPCDFDANGVLSKLTDDQWTQLLTDGTHINNQWKSLVDEICVYLQQLKDQKIEVLWRPMHEMNQGKFWWAGRPGPNGTRKLYQMLHDYMTKSKGLNNLIWVWDVQDFGSLHDDVNAYNPGADYWDVAALDVYDGSGYTGDKYNTMVTVANGKPIAIGECQTLPTAAQLTAQPKWTFFMGWSELEFSGNSEPAIKSLHTAPNVVTLDKMPGW